MLQSKDHRIRIALARDSDSESSARVPHATFQEIIMPVMRIPGILKSGRGLCLPAPGSPQPEHRLWHTVQARAGTDSLTAKGVTGAPRAWPGSRTSSGQPAMGRRCVDRRTRRGQARRAQKETHTKKSITQQPK